MVLISGFYPFLSRLELLAEDEAEQAEQAYDPCQQNLVLAESKTGYADYYRACGSYPHRPFVRYRITHTLPLVG